MPVLIRYYLMAIWPPFFLATGCTLFILNLLFYLREFLNYVFVYQAGLVNSCLLLLYIQPSFLVLAIPIGFLTAILVVYGGLSADREVMAIESSGISTSILIWPMLGVSLLMSLFLVVFMDKILPWGNTSFLKLQYRIVSERSAIVVRERVFIKDFEGYLLYVQQKDDAHDLLKGVTVEFLDEKSHPYRLIQAKEGTLREDPQNYHVLLELSDGVLQQVGTGKKESANEFLVMQFKNCALDLSARKLKNGPVDFRDARNISIRELAGRIREEKKARADTRYDELEYHKKFSIPFSALAFAFIGIPIGMIARTGSVAGPFLAVVLVVIYELFIMFGQAGGPMGVVSPFIAMWLPNGVLIAIGLVMLYWMNHRLDFWQSLFRRKGRNESNQEDPSYPTVTLPK